MILNEPNKIMAEIMVILKEKLFEIFNFRSIC